MHADFSVELGRDDPALELPWRSDDPQVRYYDVKNHPELVHQIPEAVAYPPLSAFLMRMNAAGFPLRSAKCDAWESREVAPEEEIFGNRKFVSYVDLVFDDEAARRSLEKHEAFAEGICRLLARAPEIAATVELVIRRCYYHGLGSAGPGEEEAEVKRRPDADCSKHRVHEAGKPGVTNRGELSDVDEARIKTGGTELGGRESDWPRYESAAGERRGKSIADGGADGPMSGKDESASSERRGPSKPERSIANGVASEEGSSIAGFCFTVYVTGFGDEENPPRRRWEVALVLLQNALVQLAKSA